MLLMKVRGFFYSFATRTDNHHNIIRTNLCYHEELCFATKLNAIDIL